MNISYLEFNYYCFECEFNGWVKEISYRKVQCPECRIINDVWLGNETPPTNHQ